MGTPDPSPAFNYMTTFRLALSRNDSMLASLTIGAKMASEACEYAIGRGANALALPKALMSEVRQLRDGRVVTIGLLGIDTIPGK